MSRDLTICGVQKETYFAISEDVIDETILSISKMDYEQWAENGLIEIISYRSKSLCFAITQIVLDLAENGYGIIEGISIKSSIGSNCIVLSKSELITIIQWLELTSKAMGQLSGKVSPIEKTQSEFFHQALQVCNKSAFSGNEFDQYWFAIELFQQWRGKIESSNFEYYYWEDSY